MRVYRHVSLSQHEGTSVICQASIMRWANLQVVSGSWGQTFTLAYQVVPLSLHSRSCKHWDAGRIARAFSAGLGVRSFTATLKGSVTPLHGLKHNSPQ